MGAMTEDQQILMVAADALDRAADSLAGLVQPRQADSDRAFARWFRAEGAVRAAPNNDPVREAAVEAARAVLGQARS